MLQQLGTAFLLGSIMFASQAAAQSPDTVRLSLSAAVERALRFGDGVRLAQAQVDVTDAQVAQARATGLPQVRLAGTFNHVYENARANAVGSIFNQPNTYNANANISQVVFQGGRIVNAWRAASRTREAAGLNEAEARALAVFNVQRSYMQVLFTQRLVEIQTASLQRARSHLADVERLESAGRSSRYDVLRARVQVANLEPAMIQAQNDHELAQLDLKRVVNAPMTQPLALTTAIDAETAQEVAQRVAAVMEQAPDRSSLRAAELTASARDIGVKVARADFLPTVSVFLQSGYQAFPVGNRLPPGMGRIISAECPPGSPADRSCITHNGGWFADRSMGVQVSWPLFDGLRAKGNLDLAQAQARVAELQLSQQREQVAVEVAAAKAGFTRAKALFEARRQNTGEAAEALRLVNLRYARGLSTQLEVSDAQLALMQAESNEARAIYDYYLAAAEVARALGQPIPLPGGEINPRDDLN